MTTMITFGFSIYYKHIDTLITTISQTGNFPPESYIFTFVIFTIDLIFEKKRKELNVNSEFIYILKDFTFYIGIAACLSYCGLAIISWETNAPIHGGFTVIMFLSNSIHCLSSTILQIYLKMKNRIKSKILVSLISFILMMSLFYVHYKENDWINFKYYLKIRSILETTTIYSLFSYSIFYYFDFENFKFDLIESETKKE
eukprot:gene5472-9290_t